MYKLVVFLCLLVSVLASPFGHESRFRPPRLPVSRGCANRVTGWVACAFANSTDSLAPHPFDCRLFYYCSDGAPACRSCPAGLHFSPSLHVCDWPSSAGCSARPTRPPRPHNSTEPAYTTTEVNSNSTEDWSTTIVPETDATSSSANSTESNSSSNGTASFTWPSEG